MSTDLEGVVSRDYDAGFVTDIPSDVEPPGLDEDVIRRISARKEEPEWLLEWRLAAFRKWKEMADPSWAYVDYVPVDYQSISYYAAPKGPKYKSLDDVPRRS